MSNKGLIIKQHMSDIADSIRDNYLSENNLFDKSTAKATRGISASNGAEMESPNASASDYIELTNINSIILSGTNINFTNGGAFYNSSKVYVSGFTHAQIKAGIDVPTNAKYIRFSTETSALNTTMLNSGKIALPYTQHRKTQFKPREMATAIFDMVQDNRKQYGKYLPSVNFKDTEGYIENTAELPIELNELNGKIYQETRSGKNKVDCSSFYSKTISGVAFTPQFNSDSTLDYIEVTGTSTTTYADVYRFNISDLPAGNYKLNGLSANTAGGNNVVRYVLLKANDTGAVVLNTANTDLSFTQDSSSPYTTLRIDIYQTGAVNLILRPMIRLASVSDNTYESYGVAPSIDYPSEVKTTENTDVVFGNKNLLKQEFGVNPSNTFSKVNNLTFTVIADKAIGWYGSIAHYKLKKNETYIISVDNFGYGRLGLSNSNTIYPDISRGTTIDSSIGDQANLILYRTRKQMSFKSNKDQDCYVWYCTDRDRTTDTNSFTFSIQLEQGTTATPYTPHKEEIYPLDLVNRNRLEDNVIPSGTNPTTINATLKKGTYTLITKDKSNFAYNVYIKLLKNGLVVNENNHLVGKNVNMSFSTSFYNYYGVTTSTNYLTFTIDNDYDMRISNPTAPMEAMLIKGDTDLSYVPYTEPYNYTLGKIKGSIDNWNYTKEFNYKKITNTMTWINGGGATGVTRYYNQDIVNLVAKPVNNATKVNGYSNIGIVTADDTYTGNKKGIAVHSNGSIYIDSSIKNILSAQNIYLIYPLQTPTTEQITNPVLIEQLNNIYKMKTYEGGTNISQNANVPVEIDMKAYLDIASAISNTNIEI